MFIRINMKKIIIGIVINIISSVVMMALSWYWDFLPWYIAVAIVVAIIIIDLAIVFCKSFRRIGLLSSYKKRGDSSSFKQALSTAESTVDFLVSWGGSLPGLSSYWQREVSEMVNKGIKFRFLILKPNSFGSVERQSRGSSWTTDDHISVLNALLRIKKDRIESGHWDDFKVALYDTEASWSMAFVDEKRASIGFYGRGVGRDHPSLEIIKTKSLGLFDFYRKTYEDMWSIAAEKYSVHTIEDLNRLLGEDNMKKNKGLIYCFLGPCGSGKTSIVNSLLTRIENIKQLSTITTRPQREKAEAESQYKFVSEEEFEINSKCAYALETSYCGNKYAIDFDEIEKWENSADDYVMDSIFDPQELRKIFKERVVLIYLTASSNQTMIDRVRGRFNNNRALLMLRAEHARTISASAALCDYIVYTDKEWHTTLNEVMNIIQHSRQSFNSTGNVCSDADIVKNLHSGWQIDNFGLPTDEVSI